MNQEILTKKQMALLSNCHLFAKIPESLFPEILNYLQASVRSYRKNELIVRLGEPLLYACIVLEGKVEGSFLSENCDKINMNYFEKGKLFAEALACSQVKSSPIQLRTLTDCTLLLLNLNVLYQAESLRESYQQQLSINLIQSLVQQNIFSNLKLRIANQKVLRDRIFLYLYSLAPDMNGWLHIPFTQTALAEFLGVNRSALSRELGRMQDEGLLVIDKKALKLL